MKMFDELIEQEISRKLAKDFIESYHYTHRLGRPSILSLGYYYKEKLIAVITFDTGGNRNQIKWLQKIDPSLNKDNYLELTRVCLHPDHQIKNLCSHIISRAIRYVKRHKTKIRILISYADTNQNHNKLKHVGYIYQASNWIYVGTSSTSYRVYVDGKELPHRHIEFLDKTYIRKRAAKKQKYIFVIDKTLLKSSLVKKFKKIDYPKESTANKMPICNTIK